MNLLSKTTFSFHKPFRLGGENISSALKQGRISVPRLTRVTYKKYYPDITAIRPSHSINTHARKPAESSCKIIKKTGSEVYKPYESKPRSARAISFNFTFRVGTLVKPLGKISIVSRRRKKRISWDPSPSLDIMGYRLYWSTKGHLDYDCDFAEVGNACELTLPDDIPSFPLISGKILLGLTAVSKSGNQSDMQVLSTFVDLVAPESPANLKAEDV